MKIAEYEFFTVYLKGRKEDGEIRTMPGLKFDGPFETMDDLDAAINNDSKALEYRYKLYDIGYKQWTYSVKGWKPVN